jgi:hypothetical protein
MARSPGAGDRAFCVWRSDLTLTLFPGQGGRAPPPAVARAPRNESTDASAPTYRPPTAVTATLALVDVAPASTAAPSGALGADVFRPSAAAQMPPTAGPRREADGILSIWGLMTGDRGAPSACPNAEWSAGADRLER